MVCLFILIAVCCPLVHDEMEVLIKTQERKQKFVTIQVSSLFFMEVINRQHF